MKVSIHGKNGCKYTLVTGHVHGYKHKTTSKSNSAYILRTLTFVWKYQMQCRNGAIGHLAICSTVIWLHTHQPLTTTLYCLFYVLFIELVAKHTLFTFVQSINRMYFCNYMINSRFISHSSNSS